MLTVTAVYNKPSFHNYNYYNIIQHANNIENTLAMHCNKNLFMSPCSFWEGHVFFFPVNMLRLPSTAISSRDLLALCINDLQCLCIFAKFLNSGVFVNPTTLPLATEELLQWILTYFLT